MTARPGTRRSDGSGWRFVRDLVVIVVVALLASFLIKTFLIRSFYIPSASMENTLLGEPGHHDRILVDELVPHVVPLQRGDVIVFKDPGGWLDGEPAPVTAARPPFDAVREGLLSLIGMSDKDADDHLVKRVIGLPGDHVECCNALGQMSVNGIPLHEPYVKIPPGESAVSLEPFDVTIRAGTVWVMGDNRYNSKDSRYHLDTPTHGGVPVADIVGRAFVISWPADRWAYLSNQPDIFTGIPDATNAGPAGR